MAISRTTHSSRDYPGVVRVICRIFKRSGLYSARGPNLIDATLIPVSKQRNKRKENEQISQGELPEDWKDNPRNLSQKDREARWTKKNGVSQFGYKDHINVDKDYGFIRQYEVTDASVHDSKVLGTLLDDENEGNQVWADSAYRSGAIEEVLALLDFESLNWQLNDEGQGILVPLGFSLPLQLE